MIRYFQYMDDKDLGGMLELFDYDAVVYEPFSKINGLHGRSAIEPFLKVAMMANSDVRRTIKMEKPSEEPSDINCNNCVIALMTFEKGEQIKGRFTFEFTDARDLRDKKIKSLRIEFP